MPYLLPKSDKLHIHFNVSSTNTPQPNDINYSLIFNYSFTAGMYKHGRNHLMSRCHSLRTTLDINFDDTY